VLQRVLPSVREPCLFWLDAHCSGGDTARGREETPVFRELPQILGHPVEGHVILIDDVQLLDGTHFRNLDSLLRAVRSLKPSAAVTLHGDILCVADHHRSHEGIMYPALRHADHVSPAVVVPVTFQLYSIPSESA